MEFRKGFVNLKICPCDIKYTKRRTKADAGAHDKMGVQFYLKKCIHCPVPCADPEEDPPPHTHTHPENHKNIKFLRNTEPDPLKFSKLQSQHSTLGHHRHASEKPFKGVSLAGQ